MLLIALGPLPVSAWVYLPTMRRIHLIDAGPALVLARPAPSRARRGLGAGPGCQDGQGSRVLGPGPEGGEGILAALTSQIILGPKGGGPGVCDGGFLCLHAWALVGPAWFLPSSGG